jgi:hypothetical protein
MSANSTSSYTGQSGTFELSSRLQGDVGGVVRWLCFGILLLLVAGIAYDLLAVARGLDPGGPLVTVVYLAVLGSISFAAFWGFLGLAPGAVQCDWDIEGFTLRYRSGRAVQFQWTEPGLSIRLRETKLPSGVAFTLTQKRPLFSWPWLNPIPEDLCRKISNTARERNLRVATSVSRAGSFAEVSTIISGNP